MAPWARRREQLCLAWSPEHLALCHQTCQQFLPQGLEELLIQGPREASTACHRAVTKGEGSATLLPSPDGLLLGASLPFRRGCHPTVWPQISGFILLCTPQILCPAWSSLVAAYISSFVTSPWLQRTPRGCNHSGHLPAGLVTHGSHSFPWETPTQR